MPKDIDLNLGKRNFELREGLYNALELAVLDSLSRTKSGLVVDVGAGRGELIRRLVAREVECLGLDPEADCIALASKYGNCILGSVQDLPKVLGNQTPEVIVCSHVLEHLNSPYDAIRIMHQTGATELVLAVPNVLRSARLIRALLGKRRGDHPEHIYAWAHAEFATLVKRVGYQPVQWYADRTTINPFENRVGRFLTSKLKSFEERTLTKLLPTLSSSLILRCRRNDKML